jgi:hypothetical protein
LFGLDRARARAADDLIAIFLSAAHLLLYATLLCTLSPGVGEDLNARVYGGIIKFENFSFPESLEMKIQFA